MARWAYLLVAMLVALYVDAFNMEQVYHPKPQDFERWMAEGGIPVSSQDNFVQLRRKLFTRVTSWAGQYLEQNMLGGLKSKDYPYFAFIPPFEGAVIPNGPAIQWSANCFKNNTAQATMVDANTVAITLTLAQPTSMFCSDNYMMATLEGLQLKSFFFHGEHHINWTLAANLTEAEQWDVNTKGIRFFQFLDDPIQTIGDLISTLTVFAPILSQDVPDFAAKANLDFLQKYAGITMPPRTTPTVEIDESLIQSGDFFGVLRLDGLDPMLAWAMGSTTGHTTVALRIDGQLYITESTTKDSYWPTDGIQMTPYQLWLQQARAAGYHVVWAPLKDEYRAKFNADAAYKRFQELQGLEYGYHNLLFGWIDTVKDNYPCLPPDYTQCLQWQHIEILFGLIGRVIPFIDDVLFSQAMNKRLSTTGLSIPDVFYESAKRGIPVETLPTMPELDEWDYDTTRNGEAAVGKSMVCCVFVCNMWKAAGIFDEIGNDFNCGELTNWDDYSLSIMNTTGPLPPQCLAADPGTNVCQIEGLYALRLNNFGYKSMYPHMAEHCPSLPPLYKRPVDC